LLKEANGKIDVLQAEVKALKELVLTSTPSTPNKHLHPHLIKKTNSTTSHSRQSSLNQQQFNSMLQSNSNGNPNNSQQQINSTSSPVNVTASSTNLSQNNTLNLISSLYFNGSISKANDNEKNESLLDNEKNNKIISKSNHKRVPSYNEIKANPKSLIDKLFQTNSNNNNNNNTPVTIIKNEDCSNSNVCFHSASISIQIAEVTVLL
jgi:hypothetical protein